MASLNNPHVFSRTDFHPSPDRSGHHQPENTNTAPSGGFKTALVTPLQPPTHHPIESASVTPRGSGRGCMPWDRRRYISAGPASRPFIRRPTRWRSAACPLSPGIRISHDTHTRQRLLACSPAGLLVLLPRTRACVAGVRYCDGQTRMHR